MSTAGFGVALAITAGAIGCRHSLSPSVPPPVTRDAAPSMSVTSVDVPARSTSEVLNLGRLELEAPKGYSMKKVEGPDFDVFYVESPARRATLGIYAGNWPSPIPKVSNSRSEPLTLGERKGFWTIWEKTKKGETILQAQVILDKPFGDEPSGETVLHLFVSAKTPVELKAMQAVALTLRPAQKAMGPTRAVQPDVAADGAAPRR